MAEWLTDKQVAADTDILTANAGTEEQKKDKKLHDLLIWDNQALKWLWITRQQTIHTSFSFNSKLFWIVKDDMSDNTTFTSCDYSNTVTGSYVTLSYISDMWMTILTGHQKLYPRLCWHLLSWMTGDEVEHVGSAVWLSQVRNL